MPELLIVDGVEADRESARRFFDRLGFVCTLAKTAAEARALAVEKFFPAALVDLDVDAPNAGLDVVRFIRERSSPTGVILLTERASFDGAVEALRIGAVDVVHKAPQNIPLLKQTVEEVTDRYVASTGGDALYREAREVLDEGFRVMIGLSKKVYAHLSEGAGRLRPSVLLVDDDSQFLYAMRQLTEAREWQLTEEVTGSAALDRGIQERFDIVVSRDEVTDLRGTMLLRSIQAHRAEVLGLVFSERGEGGYIERMQQGQSQSVDRPFRGAAHLVAATQQLVNELATLNETRRSIQAFRNDHSLYVRRHADLLQKLDRLIAS